jgi:UDP-2,3-diacylglucosamine hydrolase
VSSRARGGLIPSVLAPRSVLDPPAAVVAGGSGLVASGAIREAPAATACTPHSGGAQLRTPDAVNDAVLTFVSDAHFGSGPDELVRRRTFTRFLDSLHGTDRLIVAGDLFQFWFDLGRTMPKGFFDVLAALHRLRLSGTRIDYLGGNHDYWRSRFFPDELGVEIHSGPFALEAQGRRVLVLHGDGEGPGDHGYKLLRRFVRSPLTIGAARLLHPDLLATIAQRAGLVSRAHTDQRPPDLARLEAVARAGFARGHDAVVLGHVHVQIHRQLEGGELLVIGDWLDLKSYVRLVGGRFELGRWNEVSG